MPSSESVQVGEHEALLQHLPAFPDNLNYLPERGTFWVAFYARASAFMTVEAIFTNNWVRALVGRIPESVAALLAPKVAGGMEFDGSGNVYRVVVDAAGALASTTTSAVLVEDRLVLGNLKGALTVVDLR